MPGWEAEGIVSGTHLLGSLAITRGEVGEEWRRRIAQNVEVRHALDRIANGENESAARAARRALATLGEECMAQDTGVSESCNQEVLHCSNQYDTAVNHCPLCCLFFFSSLTGSM